MWTILYKHYYIHGYNNKNDCRIQDKNYNIIECKSLHSAKCKITRLINSKG